MFDEFYDKKKAANQAKEEKEMMKLAAANQAKEEKAMMIMKLAAAKIRTAAAKVTNATVCRQQYQENYHNGPQEMPIVVPMNDAMLGIIDTLREGQFCDIYMLQV